MKLINMKVLVILVVISTITLPWYFLPNEPYYDVVDVKEYISFERANSILVKPITKKNDYYYTETRTYERMRGKFPFVYKKKQITKSPRQYWSRTNQ